MKAPAQPVQRGYTDAQGRKTADAPPAWPFGTVRPPSKAQMQRDALAAMEPAPF